MAGLSPLPPALGRACWDGFTHRRTMSRAASSGVLSSLCAVVAAPTHPHPWHLYTPVLAVEAHTWDGRHGLTGKAHLREDGRPGGNGHMLRKVGVTHELVLSGELDEYITHTHTHTPQRLSVRQLRGLKNQCSGNGMASTDSARNPSVPLCITLCQSMPYVAYYAAVAVDTVTYCTYYAAVAVAFT